MTNSTTGLKIEPLPRTDARLLVENRLRLLRRIGQSEQYEKLQVIHNQTF